MLPLAMADLLLEIVEGPGAGRQISLDRELVIGRAPDVDLVLEDAQASRRHAKVAPASDGSAVVEDLGSANGTFINHAELVGPARLDRGDELLIGVTLIQARSPYEVAQQPSALRVVPPALATPPRAPDYINADAIAVEESQERSPGLRELDRFLDVKVRRKAQLAPLALLMIIAIALSLYFATK